MRDIVARLDGETLDAIARLWVRGKGLPDREQQALDAGEVVLRGWKRGDMLAWSDVFPIRTDLYELDDRLVEADELYCPVPNCDCGEVVVDFVTAAPPRGGPPVGRVRILPTGDPKLEPREGSRDPVRDRERIEQLWAAFVRRHPRWRERFALRIPTMKAIGARVVPEGSATASAGRVSKNAPWPCGSGQKYKKCCGVVQ